MRARPQSLTKPAWALLAMVAAACALYTRPVETWAARRFQELVEEQTGLKLKIGAWGFAGDGAGLSLEDVVAVAPGRSRLLDIERVSARLDVVAIMLGKARLRALEVLNPRLSLVFRGGRLVNYGAPRAADTPPAGEPKAPMLALRDLIAEGLPVGELVIRDGTVVVQGPGWGKSRMQRLGAVASASPGSFEVMATVDVWRYDPGGATVSPVATPIELRDLRLDAAATGDVLELRRLVAVGPAFDVTLSGALPLEAEPALQATLIATAQLDKLGGVVPALADWRGRASVSVRAVGSPASPTAQAFVQADGLAIGAYQLGSFAGFAETDGERLRMPGLRADFGGGSLTLDVDVGLTGNLPIRVAGRGTNVSLGESLAMETLTGAWVDAIAAPVFDLRGHLAPEPVLEGKAAVPITNFTVYDRAYTDPGAVRLLDIPQARIDGDVRITASRFEMPGARLVSGALAVDASAKLFYDAARGMEVTASTPFAVLEDLGEIAGVKLEGNGPLSGRVSGPYGQLAIEGQFSLDSAAVAGIQLGHIEARARYADLRLAFSHVTGQYGKTRYQGTAAIDFQRETALDIAVTAGPGDLADAAGILYTGTKLGPELAGNIRGAVTSAAIAVRGPVSQLGVDITAAGTDVSAYGQSGGAWHFKGAVQGELFTILEAMVDLDGGWVRAAGDIHGGEKLAITFDVSTPDIQRIDAVRGLGLPLGASLTAGGIIGGTADVPEIEIHGVAANVRYGGQALFDRVRMEAQGPITAWHVEAESGTADVSGDGAGTSTANASGPAVRIAGVIGLAGQVPFSGEFAATGVPLHVFLVLPTAAESGAAGASAADAPPAAAEGARFRLELSATGKGRVFLRAPAENLDAEITLLGGAFEAGKVAARTATTTTLIYREGTLGMAPVVIDGTGFHAVAEGVTPADGDPQLVISGRVSLNLLNDFIKPVAQTGGDADFRAVVRHILTDPAMEGHATLANGFVSFPALPLTADSLAGQVVFSQSRISFENLEGRIESGRVRLAGTTQLESFVPSEFNVLISVDKAPVRIPADFPAVASTAGGGLTLKGTPASMTLTGLVQIERMNYTKDTVSFEQLARAARKRRAMAAAAASPLDIDIILVAPNTLHVDNDLAHLTMGTAGLRLHGHPETLALNGKIEAAPSPGTIVLFGKEWNIAAMTAVFNDEVPIAPRFNIKATRDVQNHRIVLTIDGPLDRSTFELKSGSLSQEAIRCLIQNERECTESRGDDLSNVSSFLGEFWIRNLGIQGLLKDMKIETIGLRTERSSRSGTMEPHLQVHLSLHERVDVIYKTNVNNTSENSVVLELKIKDNLFGAVYWDAVGENLLPNAGLDLYWKWNYWKLSP